MASRRRRGPVSVDVKSNLEAAVRELGVEDPERIEDAAVEALNTAMPASKGQGVERVSKERSAPAQAIEGRMADRAASPGTLVAQVIFDPRPLNPYKLGLSVEAAAKYYKGPKVGEPFVMTMKNGSTHVVFRHPKSLSSFPKYIRRRKPKGDPAALAAWQRRKQRGYFEANPSSKTVHRRNRLPVVAVKIFIGKSTIKEFEEALQTLGVEVFEETFYRLLSKGFNLSFIRRDFRWLTRRT